jgi:imidazolonepropionase-like amidohydrolase
MTRTLAILLRRGRPSRAALVALALSAAAAGAGAAEAQTPAPPQTRAVALTGGTIHTVSGAAIENGTLVFEDGKITAVGAGVAVPAGAERIDVSGRHLWPGLIDAYSAMGLTEIGGFDPAIDLDELGEITPNVRAEVAVNPESRHIGVARSNGVLVTLSSPTGGLIAGLAAAMMLDGWTWEQMTLRGGAGLIVGWPSPANEERYQARIRELRDAFASARAYRTAHAAAAGGGARRLDSDSRWEAMIPVLDGRVPVVVAADEVRQIQDAVAWAEEEGVRLVIRGGRDAHYVADHLARKGVPVLLTSVLDSPARDWEPYDGAYGLPARLHAAGVPFAITGGASAAYANRLPYEAGAAVAYGLPVEEAVRAVTLYPARFLGIDDRVGSLEVGKDATLLITTGNPLEYSTLVEQAYVAGRRIDMRDAHRQFFEKYGEKIRQMGGGDR